GRLASWVPKTETKLNQILRGILAPDPKDRPPSAEALGSLLEEKGSFPEAKQNFQTLAWAKERTRSRVHTLILNAVASLLEIGGPFRLPSQSTRPSLNLAYEILQTTQEKFPEALKAHSRYYFAVAHRLREEETLSGKYRT